MVGARVEVSEEAIQACHRLTADRNAYPGLQFSGDKKSYSLFRHDVTLVAETMARMMMEISKHIQGGGYEN